ncbi:MAG TPA: tRNA (N(6)-L-threonylcarbamoyladenosine(37)-C(2))-methylthiotransferase MtaB [Terriglobales bacterium]|nr:tRNA (N(6)-L-threonylcarbamoyladenosine(37)-C(2))-methylthiotransferase MtaB [Terriglobales bacterium]
MATFYVENFGCRATQADGASLERQFVQKGLLRADAPATAELVVLNTCTVTAAADHDARAAIRRIHRQNPQAQIVVTGCYAQRAPEELAALEGVTQVIGNSHKHILADLTCQLSAINSQSRPQTSDLGPQNFVAVDVLLRPATCDPRPIWVSDIFAHTELLAAPVFDAPNERTRPNLKIQDGCNNRCSFCVIPYVRGRSRSLPEDRILQEVNALVGAGYQEVVLSGINLGRWGRDLNRKQPAASREPLFGQRRFADVIRLILEHTSVPKLRISSVEPMDWTDDLISLVASSPRIAKHAHVPLQSGSDAVLRRMHRKYRPRHYEEKVRKIRAAMPDAAIGADVMVGFPGETDAEFEATRRMIEDLPFTYLHVFTYSARPGTPAATMSRQVPERITRQRNRILRDLAAQKKQTFMNSFLGRTISAITLHDSCGAAALAREASTEALTDNFLKMRLAGQHPANRWIEARVRAVTNDVLVADIVRRSDFTISQSRH